MPFIMYTILDREKSHDFMKDPGGARFSASPDRPWGPPSLLYNGNGSFPGVKYGRGVLLTTNPLLVPWSWKSRAIPLATAGPQPGL
jgi:hypothetical protein